MKKPTPKNLYVRYVDNGRKLSVGEYLRAKWFNVCDPFKPDDADAVAGLLRDIQLFEKRENRPVQFQSYGDPNAVAVLLAKISSQKLTKLLNR